MRAALAGLTLLGVAGCENQVPTATGSGGFPAALIPTTIELTLSGDRFVVDADVYTGYVEPRSASYLLVANRFDGALDAHALARFRGFPDSVSYVSGTAARTDRNFAYTGARVITRVDSLSSAPRVPVTLQLWSVSQPWDTATVTWERAVDRPGEVVPWQVPGGTRESLLAEATWTPRSTTAPDTVIWNVDSLAVRRLARGEIAGLLVRSAHQDSRLELSPLTLETSIRPEGRQDTTLVRTIGPSTQTFVLTPGQPEAEGVLTVGGVTGDRTVLRLDLSAQVPTCPPPATGPGCRTVPLREVTLDRVSLLLDPLPVPWGYRPVAPTLIHVRRVLEPELGRLAPLGEILASDTITAAAFLPGATEDLSLLMTGPVQQATASESPTLAVAVMAPFLGDFGYPWFAASPRLRIIYTVPNRPQLP